MNIEVLTEIKNIFTPSHDDLNQFPFLIKYNELIIRWLEKNTFDDNQLQRFMLIGFWSDYRASNHQSSNFTTLTTEETVFDEQFIKEFNEQFKDIMSEPMSMGNVNFKNSDSQRRKELYNIYFDPILSTENYLSLAKCLLSKKIKGKLLFNFVIKGI